MTGRVAVGSGYVTEEPIGRGGMGQVFRGTVRESGEAVAVKLLRPELTADGDVVARFVQERTILTQVEHPNVVRVRDMVAEGETLAIVMDLVEGKDLRRYLASRGGRVSPQEAARLIAEVLEGLAAVHAAGVVHRDLKPENILVDLTDSKAPRLRLTDFGIARITRGPSLTRATGLIGTPEYMAPEMAEREHASPAADLYSAGIVLYELVAGRTPFAGGHPVAVLRRHLEDQPVRPDGMPGPLWSVIAALLAKDPAARPQSAAEVAATLRRLSRRLKTGRDLVETEALVPFIAPEVTEAVTTPGQSEHPTHVARGSARPAASHRTHARRHRVLGLVPSRRRWRVAALLVATALVASAVVGVMRLTRPSPVPTAAQLLASQQPVYAFSPALYSSGLVATRQWTLTGPGRVHTALTLANSSATRLTTTFDEVIPKSLAPTVSKVVFQPAPASILKADPVVRYSFDLAPATSTSLGYDVVGVATGVDAQKMFAAWATDWKTASDANGGPAPLTLASIAVPQASVTIAVGAPVQLTASGLMSDGSPAPAFALAGIAWSSSAPVVATATPGGLLTGISVGAATVSAQAGTLPSAHVAVTVVDRGFGTSRGGSTDPGTQLALSSSGSGTLSPPSTPTPIVGPTPTQLPPTQPPSPPAPTPTPQSSVQTFSVPCGNPAALVAAINSANQAGFSGKTSVIQLANGCTYSATHADNSAFNSATAFPVIATTITIEGAGATIDAGRNGSGRVLAVDRGGNLTLHQLTITNGSSTAEGGGIYSIGTLELSDATLSANDASGYGGGIFSSGVLRITGSTVTGNTTGSGGGGIATSQSVRLDSATIVNSTVSNNVSNAPAPGGGMYYDGFSLSIQGSSFTGNTSHGRGGGLFCSEPGASVSAGSVFSGDHSDNDGGGLSCDTITVSSSRIENNSAGGNGGGIAGSQNTIDGSSISGNTAVGNGGGIDNYQGGNPWVLRNGTTVQNNKPNNCYPSGSVSGCAG